MKKVLLTTLIALLIIPIKAYALTGTVTISCDNEGLYEGTPTTCTISGTSDDIVTGIAAIINYDDDEVVITNFALSDEWESTFGAGTITPGTELYFVADATIDVEGEFDIATFEATLAENATSTSQEITLSSIIFYDEVAHTTSITGTPTASFEDYLTLGEYTVDTTKMIIHHLLPVTIGAFKNTVPSNAVLKVFDKLNNLLTDLDHLATGQTFKATFKNQETSYKISIAGDVLGNGEVTENDAKKIAEHIIDGDVITGDEYLLAADYDGNTHIKMNDVMRLLLDLQSQQN